MVAIREPVNYADAVRLAFQAGKNENKDVVDYIKDKFGINVEPSYVSTIRSHIKTGRMPAISTNVGRDTKRGRKPRLSEPQRTSPHFDNGNSISLTLEEFGTIKRIVDERGADTVRKAVDLVA